MAARPPVEQGTLARGIARAPSGSRRRLPPPAAWALALCIQACGGSSTDAHGGDDGGKVDSSAGGTAGSGGSQNAGGGSGAGGTSGAGGNAGGAFSSGGAGAGGASSAAFGFGAPVVLADNLAFPSRLVLGPAHAYYGNRGGTVERVPLSGGAVETLASGEGGPAGVYLRDSLLYWVNSSTHQLRRIDLSGGVPETLGTFDSVLSDVTGSADFLYVAHYGRAEVHAVGIASGTSTVLSVSAAATRLLVSGAHLYFNDVAATDMANGAIYEANLDGAGVRQIVSDVPSPEGIAVQGGDLYYAASGAFPSGQTVPSVAGGLYRVALVGGTPERIFPGDREPFAVAVDARYVYVTERAERPFGDPQACDTADGRLVAIPLPSGAPRVLAEGLVCPSTIALTDSAVFWVNNGDTTNFGTGSLMRVDKVPE